MSHVVIVLSWAGWIWTVAFFSAVGVFVVVRRGLVHRRPAGRGFEVIPANPDLPTTPHSDA